QAERDPGRSQQSWAGPEDERYEHQRADRNRKDPAVALDLAEHQKISTGLTGGGNNANEENNEATPQRSFPHSAGPDALTFLLEPRLEKTHDRGFLRSQIVEFSLERFLCSLFESLDHRAAEICLEHSRIAVALPANRRCVP